MDYDYVYDPYGDIDADNPMLQAFYDGEDIDPELMEQMMNSYQDEHLHAEEYSRIAVWELLNSCILPTAMQIIQSLLPLYILCLVFKIICVLGKSDSESRDDSRMPSWFFHTSCAMFGGLALQLFFQENMVYLVICSVLVYIIIILTARNCLQYCGISVSSFIIIFLLSCELYFVDSTSWHAIRGAQIILSMKVIGLAFDIANNTEEVPGISEYLGYVFCIGTVIFGPWMSYRDYKVVLQQDKSKFSLWWLFRCIKSTVIGLLCMTFSTCLTHWIILDGNDKWLLAYRDAQSFRFSHYFISYISEATATMSGFGLIYMGTDVRWDLSTSKPYHIEIPRSLVDVVTNWNLPMHYWLKNYVFKIARPYGTFIAVILTYSASSLLHGLNFQLAAVLLSLGFYSYVEFVFRNKLSRVFDACIQAKRCKDGCEHSFKQYNPYVIIANFAFGCLAVFHLAYLGLMFDSSSDAEKGYTMEHTLSKWSRLSYASHFVVIGTYVFHLLI